MALFVYPRGFAMLVSIPYEGTFGLSGNNTQSAGTAITDFVPPYRPIGFTGQGTGVIAPFVTHLTTLLWDTTDTHTHVVYVMRPLNYTTFSAVAAAGQKVLSLAGDPGVYSTNYKYITGTGKVVSVADDPIAATDYCLYQLSDGTWFLDTANSSYSAGAVTMSTNVPTGGVLKGGLFYWFGLGSETNPGDGKTHWSSVTKSTTLKENLVVDAVTGGINTYNAGDPLLIQSVNNDTTAGVMQGAYGYYAQR
jgi:hypothetical protein